LSAYAHFVEKHEHAVELRSARPAPGRETTWATTDMREQHYGGRSSVATSSSPRSRPVTSARSTSARRSSSRLSLRSRPVSAGGATQSGGYSGGSKRRAGRRSRMRRYKGLSRRLDGARGAVAKPRPPTVAGAVAVRTWRPSTLRTHRPREMPSAPRSALRDQADRPDQAGRPRVQMHPRWTYWRCKTRRQFGK
jgi:hypothetical protein